MVATDAKRMNQAKQPSQNGYVQCIIVRAMSDDSLLLREFLEHGKMQGLEEPFLRKVFVFLFDHQYVTAGDRTHVRAQLLRLIKTEVGE